MTSLLRCRVPALAATATLALSGCGGVGNVGEDLANAVVDGLACGLRNCTESSTLNVDEISPRFTAVQAAGDNVVVVQGNLGKSANVFTGVLLAPSERLSASIDGGAEQTLANADGKRLDYSARIASSGTQPVVRLVFTRGGTRHVSQVTLPAGFTVLQPTGATLLTRSGAAVSVRLGLASVGTASAAAAGSCSRSDGSSFTFSSAALSVRTEGSAAGGYRLEPALVDESITAASISANSNDTRTPAVARCDMTVTWTVSATGTIAPTLNSHGALLGRSTASHALTYDARL